MCPTPLIDLSAVGARYGRTAVLRSVDLTIGPGEVVGLRGANGSGKSTLLRVLATLLAPSEGHGTVLGATLGTRNVSEARPQIGLLGHLPALYPELTLMENLRLIARLAGRPLHLADDLLEGVGLAAAADRRVDRSSHGMQRRVDIARLFLTEPTLLLLDEAHAGLDRAAVSLIATVVGEVAARQGATVVVSHDEAHFSSMVNRTLVLESGSLQELAA